MRKADAKTPFLPFDFPTIDLEAHPLGLHDVERLHIRAKAIDIVRGVVAHVRGNGNNIVVLHPNDFHFVEVHDHQETVNGMSVIVIAVLQSRPEQGARETQVLLNVFAVRAG